MVQQSVRRLLRSESGGKGKMTEVIDPKITKSRRAKQQILAIMGEYEATHTNEENARAWLWLRDELKASMEVPK